MLVKYCLCCDKELFGRADKKFCNSYCKSSFHFQKNKEKESSFFTEVDKQLKLNRRVLKEFNKAGKSTVRKEVLIKEGFNPKFFTHYWQTRDKQRTYLFCYEYGFIATTDNNKSKFVLVKWQKYMN